MKKRTRSLHAVLLAASVAAGLVVVVAGPVQRRVIDDVVTAQLVAKRPRPRRNRPVRKPSYVPAEGADAGDSAAESALLGVTVWRMQRSRGLVHDAAQLETKDPKGATATYSPVRVGLGTSFPAGTLTRLSIESPRTGYLYVVDREMYADGTFGKPVLIFPTKRLRQGANAVRAGKVIEVPAQSDNPSYFQLVKSRPDHVGEEITLLVTPTPLAGVKVGDTAVTIPDDVFAKWRADWSVPAVKFEMEGGEGQAYTAEEKAAGASGQPLLTQADPLPQTIYRLMVTRNRPVLVTVPLGISQ
jgi:hypothetical protein